MATYQSPYNNNQPHTTKPDFDDLVDEYQTPYSANARHQIHHISPGHSRRPSAPMTPQSSGKMSEDDDNDFQPIYPPVSAKEMEPTTRPSLWQRLIPESLACRLFVLTVLIETAVDLAIEADLLLRINSATNGSFEELDVAQKKMPVYLALFALAHVFQFVMAVDAVYARNTLQFMALIVFNALFLGYSVIQITEIRESFEHTGTVQERLTPLPIQVLTTTIPIVVSVAEIAFMALGWKLYHEFGWKVYKFLGADRRVKTMYGHYQIYICLIKFDVFFWAAFSIQFIWLVLKNDDWEYYVTCGALPLSLILLVEGHLAARHENKWMMATFMSGCVAAMVYFVYKLARVLMEPEGPLFSLVWKSLTIFSVIAMVLLIATFVMAVVVLRNFGTGLKDALARQDATHAHQRFASKGPHRRVASTNLNRMSID